MIQIKKFEEINFDVIPKDQIRFDWEMTKGFYIYVYNDKKEIQYKSYIPKSLHWAIFNYIDSNYQKARTWSDL